MPFLSALLGRLTERCKRPERNDLKQKPSRCAPNSHCAVQIEFIRASKRLVERWHYSVGRTPKRGKETFLPPEWAHKDFFRKPVCQVLQEIEPTQTFVSRTGE